MMRYILRLVIMLGLGICGCSDEPEFPDPGLDALRDVRDTVRRDTISVYHLEMNIKAPNGIGTIQILNGRNYVEMERIDEYKGQKELMFSYPLELSELPDRDTTLAVMIKVIDLQGRSFNKTFSLFVRPFSKPEIFIKGVEGTLGLMNPSFLLRVTFETGLNTIKRFRVLFEDEQLEEVIPGENQSVIVYERLCDLEMVKGTDYSMVLELEDNLGSISSREIKLRLIDIERVKKVYTYIIQYGEKKLNKEYEFHYSLSVENQLDSVSTVLYMTTTTGTIKKQGFMVLTYSTTGKVTHLKDETREWTFEYDATDRFQQCYEGEPNGNLDIIAQDWHEDGRVKSYVRRNTPLAIREVPYAERKPGEFLCAEGWQCGGTTRGIATKFSSIMMPTSVQGFPNFFPTNPTIVADYDFLFANPYAIESEHNYSNTWLGDATLYPADKPNVSFSYLTNASGRLDKVTRYTYTTTAKTANREFVFIYE